MPLVAQNHSATMKSIVRQQPTAAKSINVRKRPQIVKASTAAGLTGVLGVNRVDPMLLDGAASKVSELRQTLASNNNRNNDARPSLFAAFNLRGGKKLTSTYK